MLGSVKLSLISAVCRARKILKKLNFTKHTPYSDTRSTLCAATQLKHVFEFMDSNGDGKLSALELQQVLVRVGDPKPEAAAEEARGMVREMDCNGDGYVDLEEFMMVMENEETGIMDAFGVFDSDRNGLISAEELGRVLARLGCINCSVKECRKMIRGVDTDGDGFVSFHEFKNMMTAGLDITN